MPAFFRSRPSLSPRRPRRFTFLALAVFSLAGATPLAAQENELELAMRHRLTSAELHEFLPYLEARISHGEGAVAAIDDAISGYAAFEARWRGGDDPLPYLRALLPDLPLPSGATYAEACSRAFTALLAEPYAIFTFGIEAAESDLALLGLSDWKPTRPHDAGVTPRRERVDSLLQAVRHFYLDRGWSPTADASLEAPNERLFAEPSGLNVGADWSRPGFSPVFDLQPERRARAYDRCTAVGWGPSLVLWGPQQSIDDTMDAPPDPALRAHLDRAYFALVAAARYHESGMTREDLGYALEEAQQMAEIFGDPSHLEVERVRQANLAAYRAHPRLQRLHAVIGRLEGW
jgi:hypothetical protein